MTRSPGASRRAAELGICAVSVSPSASVIATREMAPGNATEAAFLAAVEVVRRGAWKGTYTERGGQLSGQNAGRCADRWMENADNP